MVHYNKYSVYPAVLYTTKFEYHYYIDFQKCHDQYLSKEEEVNVIKLFMSDYQFDGMKYYKHKAHFLFPFLIHPYNFIL